MIIKLEAGIWQYYFEHAITKERLTVIKHLKVEAELVHYSVTVPREFKNNADYNLRVDRIG